MAAAESIRDENHLTAGLIILTVGVLSILISAPLGAFFIHILAPILLSKDGTDSGKSASHKVENAVSEDGAVRA